MKKYLISVAILLIAFKAVSQSLADVDLRRAYHTSGYLQNNTTHERRKIMWYPAYTAYRMCNDFTGLQKVAPGFTFIDEDCNCSEDQGRGFTSSAYTNIQFDYDSSSIKPSAYPVLDAVSADLISSAATLELDGYSSAEGTAAHNVRLSKDRANSIKTYLVNSGVNPQKVKIKGYGESHPIADNSTEEGRIINRRVEFKKH